MRRYFPFASVVVAALALSMTATASQAAVAGFGDVVAEDYYADAVQWMADNDITGGTAPGCFSPGLATTRGQIATFIHRANGQPRGETSNFRDVADDAFYADAVAWMASRGITTGTTPSTFAPDRHVTRGELATFLHRAEGSPASGTEAFVDVHADDFFADAVGWMVAEGITTGTSPRTFSPDRLVTRAEVAAFLYRTAGSPSVRLVDFGACGAVAEVRELDVAEAASFDLVNEIRVEAGIAPLARLSVMDAAARDWSATMDRTGDFEHSSLPYAENIAWWSNGSAAPERAAQILHDLWVNSPGHYANMMNGNYTSIGVGFWRSDDGGWNATHVFR